MSNTTITGVENYRANLTRSEPAGPALAKGYKPWDSLSMSVGAAFHSNGEGQLISLGTVGNVQAFVTVPKTIFEYYPPWMKQHNQEMDLKRWEELAQIHKVELEETGGQETKIFFELVKIVAAMTAGGAAALTLVNDRYRIILQDGVITAEIVENRGVSRSSESTPGLKPENEQKERIKQKIAEKIVQGLFLPATIVRFAAGGLLRIVDAVGNGLELVWQSAQPVLAPLGSAIAMVFQGARRVLQPLINFLQTHTKPMRAREDAALAVRWVLKSADLLAGALGPKWVGRTIAKLAVGPAGACAEFVQRVCKPPLTWLADKATQLIDALVGLIARFTQKT